MSRQPQHLHTWLVFIPLVALSTVFFGSMCLLLAPFMSPRRVAQWTAVPWSRFGLWLSRIKVEVRGREYVAPGQSYIVVANHLSLYDIWVLYGWLGMDIRWVAKKEVRYIPIIGIACVALGHVFVDRSDPVRAAASLEKAKRRICNGTSIIFFPEGTRSRNGELQQFKKGAFRMAHELLLPVLPVSIRGTREILPSDTSDLTPGREVTVVIHAPIPVTDQDKPEVDHLLSLSRSAIAAGLEGPATA